MRLMTFAAVAAAPLMMLAACDWITPAPAPEPAPPPAASTIFGGLDLSQPFTVRGTEPFWAIAVTPALLDYSGVDRPQQTAANPGPVIGTTAVYTVTTSLSNPMVVTLTVDPTCTDGMSETVYPLAASVLIGTETLTGCAGA